MMVGDDFPCKDLFSGAMLVLGRITQTIRFFSLPMYMLPQVPSESDWSSLYGDPITNVFSIANWNIWNILCETVYLHRLVTSVFLRP